MTLGDFTAFNSYLAILIFPVILIGFMSNVMAQASASYQRIAAVLDAPRPQPPARSSAELRGDITVDHVVVTFGEQDGAEGRVVRGAGPAPGRRSSARPRPARRSCSTC